MSDSEFWDFSLRLYAHPEVAQACLALQDDSGADVNVLLFVLFAAHKGRVLDEATMDRIEALVRDWRTEVVVPLRAIRRRLKGPVGEFEPTATSTLRNEVKRIELAAERLQQEKLESSLSKDGVGAGGRSRGDCARQNVALYLERLGSTGDARGVVLISAFEGLSR